MNAYDVMKTLQNQGMALLEHIHTLTRVELLADGFVLGDIKKWQRTATDFLGPTKSTAKQRDTLRLARQRGHSLDTLVMINSHARKVGDKAWELRLELAKMNASYETIDQHAKMRVKQLVQPAKKARVGYTTRTVDDYSESLTITGPSAAITDLDTRVREKAGSTDPVALATAFHELVTEGGGGPVQATPAVIIGLDKLDEVLAETEDGLDYLFARTDGARMTGAEIVEQEFAKQGFAVLVNPMEGSVNAYHVRFANRKQRLMSAAENPICPVPGCSIPADRCQVHHLTPYSKKPHTHAKDLTTCCAFHNGRNDDDPNAPPKNGRLVRGPTGWVGWQYAAGSKIHYNMHPTAQLGALRII